MYFGDSFNFKPVNKLSENWENLSMSVKQPLMAEDEKGKLVKAKSALKSHSDAERRRRERINAHLSELRGLLPGNEKMDKATLLAQVIDELKQLKKTARQASEDQNIPVDTDEIQVVKNYQNNGAFLVRASLCCDYRPDLLLNIKEAISNLPLNLLHFEVSTLGCRVRTVFSATTTSNGDEMRILSDVRAALDDVLDKVSASADYAQPLIYPQKRQRIRYLNSSS
ncbi:transcription factor bHLH30-like [Andrographis paniculata]|uniref:transcription factor bHLH30-like n=1 Tax=Andrographis paniculata TaxID=175694 RepID=UPI0021E7F461|nr:transcription factor bHLH30-like [Andrographis paniculata]